MSIRAPFRLSLALLGLTSFAAPVIAHANGTEGTSMGTSRNQTERGSNKVKYSVIQNNSIAGAKEVTAALAAKPTIYLHANGMYYSQNRDIKTMLEKGFTIAHKLPSELAGHAEAIKVEPWKQNEEHIVSKYVAGAVALRIEQKTAALLVRSNRLHAKGEITDAANQHAHELGGYWKSVAEQFAEGERALAKNKVAVELDQ